MNRSQQPCVACGGRCMKEVSFLTALPKKTQQRILENTSHIHRNKGEYLFRNGEIAGELFFIRAGEVKLCTYDTAGREQIIALFSNGDAIWEGLFVHNSHYICSALCMTSVECCVIEQDRFEEAIRDTNSAMQVISLLSEKLQDSNLRNMIYSTYDPKARIAGFLLYEIHRNQSETVSMRVEDIGAAVSLRPETVSRKLAELRDDGIIEKTGRKNIRLLDIDALSQIFSGA